MEYTATLIRLVLCRLLVPTCHLPDYRIPREEIYGSSHFSEVPAFSQIREVLRRLLSESVDSQLPSAQQSTCQNGIFENGIFESGIL